MTRISKKQFDEAIDELFPEKREPCKLIEVTLSGPTDSHRDKILEVKSVWYVPQDSSDEDIQFWAREKLDPREVFSSALTKFFIEGKETLDAESILGKEIDGEGENGYWWSLDAEYQEHKLFETVKDNIQAPIYSIF